MNNAQKQQQLFARNTAFIAGVYGVDAAELNQWRYELGLKFLQRQFAAQSLMAADMGHELEAEKAYWDWFIYHYQLNDSRFMALHVDMVQQLSLNPTDSIKTVFKAAYKAHVQQWLKGDNLDTGWGYFISAYIRSIMPAYVDNAHQQINTARARHGGPKVGKKAVEAAVKRAFKLKR